MPPGNPLLLTNSETPKDVYSSSRQLYFKKNLKATTYGLDPSMSPLKPPKGSLPSYKKHYPIYLTKYQRMTLSGWQETSTPSPTPHLTNKEATSTQDKRDQSLSKN
jgi:hypothetical protein